MGDGEQEKVVAFCRSVPTFWYESEPVQDFKKFSFIIKYEGRDDNNNGFFPTLGFHLKLSVLMCFLCMMFYYVLTAHGYYLINAY